MNRVIGWIWSIIGFFLLMSGVLSFITVFFKDVALALYAGIPIPDDFFDFLIIFSIAFLGLFNMRWSSAMLKREEWGAVVGGLLHLTFAIYMVGGAIIFLLNPSMLLQGAASISFYERYWWLFWLLYIVFLILVPFAISYWLLFNKERRDFYALAYQDYPPPALPTCDKCGLISKEDRTCPECDRPYRKAYLMIGENKRPAVLEFTNTQEGAVKIIGREKNNSEADITISNEDCQDSEHINRISSRHVVIRYHFDYEQFTIEDMSSLNKTYLNDHQLPPSKPHPLYHEDVINLAKQVEMVFECDESST